jgi:NOL1/NOP2/fmu family ribosome biogenesis protein
LDQTKNPIQLLLEGTSDTLNQEVVPKKRARKDKEMLDKEDAAISKASHKNDMQVDTESAATRVAGSDITMQQNPLFDVNIVMAGPGHQACQKNESNQLELSGSRYPEHSS